MVFALLGLTGYAPVSATINTGSITGTATLEQTGAPAAALRIDLTRYENGHASTTTSTTTNASGQYLFANLQAGDYRLLIGANNTGDPCFELNGVPVCGEWYSNKPYSDVADKITVGSHVVVVDAALSRAVRISGTVSPEDGGVFNEGVYVYAESAGMYPGIASITQVVGGNFVTELLRPGKYVLWTWTEGDIGIPDPPYASEYFNDKFTRAQADVIDAQTDIGGVNFVLARTGTVAGVVQERNSGAPIASAILETLSSSNGADDFYGRRTDVSDLSGQYAIELRPGHYTLTVNATQFGFIPAVLTATVTGGNVTQGVNSTLLPGGAITGAVTLQVPGPYNVLRPQVFDAISDERVMTTCFERGFANGASGYECLGLPSGQYKILLRDGGCRASSKGGCVTNHPFWSQYYPSSGSLDTATPISVSAPFTTANVDFDLISTSVVPPWFTHHLRLPAVTR
jgi:hypothetical protein